MLKAYSKPVLLSQGEPPSTPQQSSSSGITATQVVVTMMMIVTGVAVGAFVGYDTGIKRRIGPSGG